MKVLLLKDVHKLGRAGDVKKVADGYGRNYLIPHGLAALATPSMLNQAERIREAATLERERLNLELGDVATKLSDLKLEFPVKAGETGKLYGSITTAMMSDAIEGQTGAEVKRSQIDSQPIKTLGVHEVPIRLTIDLIPEITVVVYREGELPDSAYEYVELAIPEAEAAGTFADLQAELEAEAQAEAEAEAEAAALEAAAEEDLELGLPDEATESVVSEGESVEHPPESSEDQPDEEA